MERAETIAIELELAREMSGRLALSYTAQQDHQGRGLLTCFLKHGAYHNGAVALICSKDPAL